MNRLQQLGNPETLYVKLRAIFNKDCSEEELALFRKWT